MAALQPAAPLVLVTSASHMPRASALFAAAGLTVTEAPAEYHSMGPPYSAWALIPSAEALQKTERAWYEYLGLAREALRRH